MGCDIHFYVEVKKNGKWAYHDYEAPYRSGKSGDVDYEKLFDDPLHVNRNYNLFAILANVRNGHGVAGIRTGDGFKPIATPKGLPEDVTKEVMDKFVLKVNDDLEDEEGYTSLARAREWVNSNSSIWIKRGEIVSHPDWHSASWHTVADLLAYDWNQVTTHEGWVDPWNFELWRKNGKPSSWWGWVIGGEIDHISNRQMAHLIDSGDLQWEGEAPEPGSFMSRPYSTGLQRTMSKWPLPRGSVGDNMASNRMARHYTLVEWKETYAESAKSFLNKTLPALQKLGKPENVRIVFWFDN